MKELKKNYDVVEYIGIAADEPKRVKHACYPLVEWGMTEKDCLDYCYAHGFDWGGLYRIFHRVSCWCCPLQSLSELRKLYAHFPELWNRLKAWDESTWRQFRADYSVKELETIIIRSASVLNVDIDTKGAHELARRSRGTPRLANRLLKRVRDFAQVEGDGAIDYDVAKTALDRLEVDSMGLDNTDRNILETMIHKFGGGPVGLDTLAAAIGEDSGTLEEVYEPYLIKNGFINRTPRGRIVTEHCYRHFGLENLIE